MKFNIDPETLEKIKKTLTGEYDSNMEYGSNMKESEIGTTGQFLFLIFLIGIGGFILAYTYQGDAPYTRTTDTRTTDIVCRPLAIKEIGQCSGAASNAFSGYSAGYCRVEFENNIRLNIPAPVMLGDKHKVCTNSNGYSWTN